MDYDKLEIETIFKDGGMIPIEYTGYGKNVLQNLKLKIYQLKLKV